MSSDEDSTCKIVGCTDTQTDRFSVSLTQLYFIHGVVIVRKLTTELEQADPTEPGSKRPSFYSANQKKKGILSFAKLRQTPINKTNKSRPADHNLLGFGCAAHEYLLRFYTISRLMVKNKRLSFSLRFARCNKNQENLRSRK
jgi:hypothetical protein